MEPILSLSDVPLSKIMELVYLQLFVCFLVGVQYLFLIWYGRKEKNRWRIVGEGVFEKVLAEKSLITAERIEGVFPLIIDTVFFKNGDTCATKWITHELPNPGTPIRIERNGLGECRVKRV